MASNNPSDYIDPIIRAMMLTSENARAAKQRELDQQRISEESRANKAREDQNAQILKETQKQHQNEMDRFGQEHDLNLKQFEVQRQQHALQSLQMFQDLIAKGYKPENMQHSIQTAVPGIGPIDVPIRGVYKHPVTGELFGPGTFRSYEETKNDAVNQAKELAAAKSQGELPARLAEIKATGENTQAVAATNATSRSETAAEATMRALSVAALNAAVRGAGQGVSADPDTVQSYLHGLYVTGDTKESVIPPKLRPIIREEAQKQGFTKQVNPKDLEALRNLQALDPVFDRFDSFSNMLSDKGLGAIGQGLLYDNKMIPSDLKTKREEVFGDLQRIGQRLEGLTAARPLLGLFDAEKGSVPNIGNRKQDAKSKVQVLRNKKKETTDSILNSYPEKQRQAILDELGIPSATPSAPNGQRKPLGDIFGGR